MQPNICMKYPRYMNMISGKFISWQFQLAYIYIWNIKPQNCISFQLLEKK